jgi:glycogen synthase
MRICVCTLAEGAAEPRAPRHAVALAYSGEGVELLFLDTAPFGASRRAVKALDAVPNLTWRTHYFPTRSAPLKLGAQKLRRRAAQVAFRFGSSPRAEGLSTRLLGFTGLLEEARADVYVTHGIETLLPVCQVAARLGALVIFDSMEFHSDVGDGQTGVEQALIRAIERHWLPECALVLASSDQLADALVQEYGISRPVALYNAPPIEAEVPHRSHDGLALYWRNAVLGLGQRGLDEALLALAQVPSDVSLHLQGGMPPDGGRSLRGRITQLGLRERVTILPRHEPDQAVKAASAYSVGLCLERRGVRNHDLTVSNKLFDYHMAGLAIIASDLPGLRSVVERSRGGLLFDPGSADDLAAKIRTLYSNRALLMEFAANARAFALREGNRETEMRKLVEAFSLMWRQRRGGAVH